MTYRKFFSQVGEGLLGDRIRVNMGTKDTRLTFRVGSDLKKKVESIAAAEGRSVAQICEAFLLGGVSLYQKEGTKYVRRFLSREETKT